MVQPKKTDSGTDEAPAAAGADQAWPGQRLGLPSCGAGAIAGLGRRIVALFIDWVLCLLIAYAFFGYHNGATGMADLGPVLVFLGENILLVGTLGSTVGHRIMGLRVTRVGGAVAGPLLGLGRSALLCLVIPAVIWDADQRGFHDRLVGTIITRTR